MPDVIPHSYSASSHYLFPQFVYAHSERLRHGNLLTHRNLKIPPFPHRKKMPAGSGTCSHNVYPLNYYYYYYIECIEMSSRKKP